MSQSQEENGQPTENSVTEDNSQEEAPQDEVDSTEDEVDSQEDMEDTEEPPQSEESDVLVEKKKRPASVEPTKKQRPASVDPKKQRPVSVGPQKKFVDDVPKEQPKEQQKTSDAVLEDVEKDSCCFKVPWSRWEELIISYLHVVIAVSSGMAGAGLNTIADKIERLEGLNTSTVSDQNPTGNATACGSGNYLSDDLYIIVPVMYSVIIILFVAQVITLIVMGAERNYNHAKLVFTCLRGLISLFTTVYFIIGWTGVLGCVTLNYFAISTTLIQVVLTGVEWYKEVASLGKAFMKDFFPKNKPPKEKDNEEALNIM